MHVCYPGLQNWPYVWLDGGIEKAAEWYADRHDRILEIRDMQDRMLAVEMEMVLEERPDFVILGGSGTITLQGPVDRPGALPARRSGASRAWRSRRA